MQSTASATTPSHRMSGTVKFFNSQKGFGFIIPDNGAEWEVFVHHTSIKNDGGFRSLAEGEVVEFDLIAGPKGYQAANVTGPGDSSVQGDPNAGKPTPPQKSSNGLNNKQHNRGRTSSLNTTQMVGPPPGYGFVYAAYPPPPPPPHMSHLSSTSMSTSAPAGGQVSSSSGMPTSPIFMSAQLHHHYSHQIQAPPSSSQQQQQQQQHFWGYSWPYGNVMAYAPSMGGSYMNNNNSIENGGADDNSPKSPAFANASLVAASQTPSTSYTQPGHHGGLASYPPSISYSHMVSSGDGGNNPQQYMYHHHQQSSNGGRSGGVNHPQDKNDLSPVAGSA